MISSTLRCAACKVSRKENGREGGLIVGGMIRGCVTNICKRIGALVAASKVLQCFGNLSLLHLIEKRNGHDPGSAFRHLLAAHFVGHVIKNCIDEFRFLASGEKCFCYIDIFANYHLGWNV